MLGRRAGELLLADADAAPERIIVDCDLIERESVGNPPKRRRRPRPSIGHAHDR
jgi:LacI family transcriptional regulator